MLSYLQLFDELPQVHFGKLSIVAMLFTMSTPALSSSSSSNYALVPTRTTARGSIALPIATIYVCPHDASRNL